jgi:RNA polymerase sigma-70 factor (ECF subfamily)
MSSELPNESPAFTTTHWSLVAAAGTNAVTRTRASNALEQLCKAYWYPLYSFVRRRGHSAADAQDLTQAFFAKFMAMDGFASADRRRGRFRSYLLGALKNFLANEWDKKKTLKRGGAVEFLEWDALEPEARYALEPASGKDAELEFDRGWALESFNRATEKLRRQCEEKGKSELFEALKGCLSGEEPDRADSARRLGISEGVVKVSVHRLRQRFRDILRAEIGQTVAEPAEVDDELRHLVAVLRAE